MKGLKMLNFSNTCPMVSSWFFGPDCWLVHGFQLHQRIQKNIWRCNMYLAVWLQSVFHCHLPFSSLDEWWSKCRANNLANINAIVAKYRGANVTQLWAQLAIKFLGVTTYWITWFIFVHLDSSWFILILPKVQCFTYRWCGIAIQNFVSKLSFRIQSERVADRTGRYPRRGTGSGWWWEIYLGYLGVF